MRTPVSRGNRHVRGGRRRRPERRRHGRLDALLSLWHVYADPAPRAPRAPRFDAARGVLAEALSSLLLADSVHLPLAGRGRPPANGSRVRPRPRAQSKRERPFDSGSGRPLSSHGGGVTARSSALRVPARTRIARSRRVAFGCVLQVARCATEARRTSLTRPDRSLPAG
jgi:hypothetical protein